MTVRNPILVPSCSLILPETEKTIEEKGYNRFKAYLYTGYAELVKLLFMSSRHFSALHNNFDVFEYERRILRTRIIKVIICLLAVASSGVIVLILTASPAWISVILKICVPLAAFIPLLAFFGIIVHTVNNLIEDILKRKPVKFTLFTAHEMERKIYDSRYLENAELVNDVNYLIKSKKQIKSLFKKFWKYGNGQVIKMKMQALIECYYLKAMESDNVVAQKALLNLVRDIYLMTDSLAFQDILLVGFEKSGEAKMDKETYIVLKNYYLLNARLFEKDFINSNTIYRMNNQKRILRLLFSGEYKEDIKKLNNSLTHNNIQYSIFTRTYIETFSNVPKTVIDQKLNEKQKYSVSAATKSAYKIENIYKNMISYGAPWQAGYMYLRALPHEDALRRLVKSDISARFRLYALLTLSSLEYNPFSLSGHLNKISKSLRSVPKKREAIPEDLEKELSSESEKVLNDDAANALTGDNYFDSLEAEMLFTAAAVSLHKKYPSVDLLDFLQQLKFTFVTDGNTEFVINYTNSDDSEHVRIAMNNRKEYVDVIKDFVESVYKRNTGEPVRFKKFETVSKGFMSLIKIVS